MSGDNGNARHQMFNAVLDVIERAAGVAPLILVLDDLHWAEPAALQLLGYLVHNLGAPPVLFVLGFPEPAQLTAVLADDATVEAEQIELHGEGRGRSSEDVDGSRPELPHNAAVKQSVTR